MIQFKVNAKDIRYEIAFDTIETEPVWVQLNDDNSFQFVTRFDAAYDVCLVAWKPLETFSHSHERQRSHIG